LNRWTTSARLVLSILLAGLLPPNDYRLMRMLFVCLAIARVFVDSESSSALIQRKKLTPDGETPSPRRPATASFSLSFASSGSHLVRLRPQAVPRGSRVSRWNVDFYGTYHFRKASIYGTAGRRRWTLGAIGPQRQCWERVVGSLRMDD